MSGTLANTGTVISTPGTVTLTVATTGTYDITAYGASGGSSLAGFAYVSGGPGATIGGNVVLTQGETIEIIDGAEGATGSGSTGGGGGGGAFVCEVEGSVLVPLVVAGGGGGAGYYGNGGYGYDLQYGINGGTLDAFWFGGAGGSGGAAGGNGTGEGPGGSGGGFGGGGVNALTGGIGAGGAGGFEYAGGGGGGYSGGGGGGLDEPGGGGGSYFDGTPLYRYEGQSYGDAEVVITNNALCFLAGTRIATPAGDVAVEDLRIGETVLCHRGGAKPVVWVGHGKIMVPARRRNHAAPVLVRAGALADGVPRRDLYVTGGHAFLFDDVLIPAEFLVNHRSIVWDDRAREIEIFHVELADHDVLLAEGAAAESYRDDGNRWLFQNGNSGWAEPTKPPCVPVLTGGPVVDAVWRRLLDRSGPRPELPLTDDADLHLLADGVRLEPKLRPGGGFRFKVPSLPSSLRIVSRSAAPDALGLLRDPRTLGVAVQLVAVFAGTDGRVIEAADDRLSEGFHAFEADGGIRWTDGDAVIPPDLYAGLDGGFEVVLNVGGRTRYLADGLIRSAA